MTDILPRLQTLKRLDLDCACFAARSHGYDLNPPVPEEEVARMEEKHGCRFPDEYRRFITELGNGGAGPAYGVLPLGMQDNMHDVGRWEDGYSLVGDLSKPFPLHDTWNLPDDFWAQQPDPTEATAIEEEDRMNEEWEKKLEVQYYATDITDGAIPICHEGCALRNWLVVTGPLAGTVWRDLRADYGGIQPLLNKDGSRMGFNDWYLQWIAQYTQQVEASHAGSRLAEIFSSRLSKLSNPKAAAFAIFCAQALYPNLEAYATAIGFDKQFTLQDRLDEMLWAQLLQQRFELPGECHDMVDSMLGTKHDLAMHLSSTGQKPAPDDAGMKAALYTYIAALAFGFDKGSPQQLLSAVQGAVAAEPLPSAAEAELQWALDQLESESSEWATAATVECLRDRAKACAAFLPGRPPETDAPAKQPWWKRWAAAASN